MFTNNAGGNYNDELQKQAIMRDDVKLERIKNLCKEIDLYEFCGTNTVNEDDMELYYGIKRIKAHPITLGGYNKLRGWDIPKDEDPDTNGYLVEYLDGGKPNCVGFDNYISWSPKDVFDKSYRENGKLKFSHILQAIEDSLIDGKVIRFKREYWESNTWLRYYSPYSDREFKVNECSVLPFDSGTLMPWIGMHRWDNTFEPYELNYCDMFANDWRII